MFLGLELPKANLSPKPNVDDASEREAPTPAQTPVENGIFSSVLGSPRDFNLQAGGPERASIFDSASPLQPSLTIRQPASKTSDKPLFSQSLQNAMLQMFSPNEERAKYENLFDSTPISSPISTPSNEPTSIFSSIQPGEPSIFSSHAFKLPTSENSKSTNTSKPSEKPNPLHSSVPQFGQNQQLQNLLQPEDTDDLGSLLQLFSRDCNLSTSFNVEQLVSEVNTINAQNELEFRARVEDKVRQVELDALAGNTHKPLPCQSAVSIKLLEVLTNHWKRRNGLISNKQRFKTRKQNAKQKRKKKKSSDYGDKLASRYGRSKGKKKRWNKSKKPY